TGGTEPYTYLWDFGDGSEESDEQTVLHTFEEAGIYNVTLTATDTDDQDASDSIVISVEEAPLPPPPPTTITEPLTAGIISNGTEGIAPATFEFQANITGGTEPYTYLWDFGDDSEGSDEQTILHTFEEAGTYEVTLVATDTDDQDASASIEISIEEGPAEVVEEGEAITTVQNQTQNNQTDTAGEEPTVQLDETSAEPAVDTFADNATEGIIMNETITPAPEEEEEDVATITTVQNQTQNNQTDTAGEEPTVQLDETSAEPGSPLAISGEGFQPDTPIQIFINNVQITNVLTNVEGSFNTVVIVPTTVAAGSAQVVVRTQQTTIVQNVNIIQLDGRTNVPSTLRLTAVSATDNGEALRNAPVTVFDASSGEVVERGRTPMDIELQEGTYSIFYSDFGRFEFESAEPGRWIDTPDGGSGLITIREGRNTTVTALYSEQPAPPPPPRVTDNSITLRTQDTQGNPIQGMFVTIYNAEAAEKIEQGFTELRVDDLPPGTYPVFFTNFEDLEFLSASPGTWIQTPFGGVGLVTIPDDGEDHNIIVTAEYNRTTVVEEEQFNIQAPLDLEGNIFTITSNQTRPEGPFVMSGTFALRVSDEEPVSATLSAFFMSAREDSNENVDLESQRSRDHDTFQIVDLKPRVARPIGLNSYVVSGTADLLLNGDMYSNDERIVVIVRGGEELTPTNIEIDFRGDERYSAANRLDTLYGVVSSGFQ
ncbi:MAG TPA: PKD domain-containing protein, partial [Nitrososphaera sp.]|nr:PKD domain-containing protein [Nitrososphaera sp.]